ncbi:hypothetical protein HAX54_040316, partial [Datura stramonium]|nr:hypothetical protein [Datura stramonium]
KKPEQAEHHGGGSSNGGIYSMFQAEEDSCSSNPLQMQKRLDLDQWCTHRASPTKDT